MAGGGRNSQKPKKTVAGKKSKVQSSSENSSDEDEKTSGSSSSSEDSESGSSSSGEGSGSSSSSSGSSSEGSSGSSSGSSGSSSSESEDELVENKKQIAQQQSKISSAKRKESASSSNKASSATKVVPSKVASAKKQVKSGGNSSTKSSSQVPASPRSKHEGNKHSASSSRPKSPSRKREALPATPSSVTKSSGNESSSTASPPKRKRGRPPKNRPPPETPPTPLPPPPPPAPPVKSKSSGSPEKKQKKHHHHREKLVSESGGSDSEGRKQDRQERKKRKKSEESKKNREEGGTSGVGGGSSESEGTKEKAPISPPSKKVTRSSSVRKSKYVMGNDSEEESDTAGFGGKAPRKKGLALGKKVGGANFGFSTPRREEEKKPAEERKCPVRGCDSQGHLSGKYNRHYMYLSCPTYHHRRKEECVAMMKDRLETEKKRAQLLAHKSHHGISSEYKAYQQKVAELRRKTSRKRDTSPGEIAHRQPDLSGITPEYDLKLFEEAQAAASEIIDKEFQGVDCSGEGISSIQMGKHEIQTWYQSPYPEDVACLPKIYICEFCLKYMKSATTLRRHSTKCDLLYPPGKEIYRKEKLNVWEIDGALQKMYCQNLCLLAKLFLDHKTLYYDVEPFLFYVMCAVESDGCHTVGYFSKEKNSFLNYNVSCILTLPPYQRQGYGRLLIDFSYLLTRTEGKTGSPEKPLSDLGIITYRNYWKTVILKYMLKFQEEDNKLFIIKDICQETGIAQADIVSTLQALGIIKYWRGRHVILKQPEVLEKFREKLEKRASEFKELDPSCLKWTPYTPPQQDQGSQRGN
ncbi:unnamed protein product [Cyprideis torosa]|uniref:Histone acetyltransferase n=1 Tax=Cyprideis torosa TaxID=163714 RepID=A0A7R8W9P5_9CRUS|nr:unnamed protein product [Cyprideis torosa]CAG0887540.1 unnamed protein product [Cyprideis torosa]